MPFNAAAKKWIWQEGEIRLAKLLLEQKFTRSAIARALGCNVKTLNARFAKSDFPLPTDEERAKDKERNFTEEDAQLVQRMASYGIPQREIASVIQCTERTLRRYFRHQLDTAAIEANTQVAGFLFEHAKRNPTAAIFWLKARAGWVEQQNLNVTTNTGVLVAPASMTPDEWIARQMAENKTKEKPDNGARLNEAKEKAFQDLIR